jgi:hypothetical protein
MLLVLQFPIADVRPFSPGPATRLELPDWPAPAADFNPQFVRHFGRACRRRRGGDAAWIDERIFCRANNALKLPGLTGAVLGGGARGRRSPLRVVGLDRRSRTVHPVCAFRRLLCDGAAVVRVEIGIANSRNAEPVRGLTDAELVSVIHDFLELPTAVRSPNGGTTAAPLIEQGSRLSRLYEVSSTRSGAGVNGDARGLVSGATPVAVVEVGASEVAKLPSSAVEIKPADVHGARVAFMWMTTPRGTVPTWLLSAGDSPPERFRSLRLCLLRLHAEREVLDVTLRQLRRGRVHFDAQSPEGDHLQQYLNRATNIVQRRQFSGVSQSAILAAADAAEDVLRPQDREDLNERLVNARNQVVRKVKEYEETRAYVRNVQSVTIVKGDLVEHNEIVVTGTVIGNVTNKIAAEKIEGSFNVVANSNASNEMKEALTLLADEVKQLVYQMEQEGKADTEVAEVAGALETFTKLAVEQPGLKDVLAATGKAIVERARAVAERVGPIANAVGAVLKIVGVAVLI